VAARLPAEELAVDSILYADDETRSFPGRVAIAVDEEVRAIREERVHGVAGDADHEAAGGRGAHGVVEEITPECNVYGVFVLCREALAAAGVDARVKGNRYKLLWIIIGARLLDEVRRRSRSVRFFTRQNIRYVSAINFTKTKQVIRIDRHTLLCKAMPTPPG